MKARTTALVLICASAFVGGCATKGHKAEMNNGMGYFFKTWVGVYRNRVSTADDTFIVMHLPEKHLLLVTETVADIWLRSEAKAWTFGTVKTHWEEDGMRRAAVVYLEQVEPGAVVGKGRYLTDGHWEFVYSDIDPP